MNLIDILLLPAIKYVHLCEGLRVATNMWRILECVSNHAIKRQYNVFNVEI